MSEHDCNMLASGSNLMRFTRFPHYCTDGPPYFDHLHEDEIQEYDSVPLIDIDVEQNGSDPSFVNTSIGDLLTVDGCENESSVSANANNVVLTGEINSAVTDRCQEESNQNSNLTPTMLSGSTVSTTNPNTATKVERHHSSVLSEYAQSFSQTKQVPNEFCEGIHNAIFEVSHAPEKVNIRGDTSVENAMFSNGEMQSTAVLGERRGSLKQSENDTNKSNFLSNFTSPLESVVQKSFDRPGMSLGCSNNCDCSYKPSITSETNDDNSVAAMAKCSRLGIKPSLKHGRKRRLQQDITSKRILRRSVSLKQAPLESFEGHTKSSHHNLILNRVQPANANVQMNSIGQLDNNPPNASQCITMPANKSSTDGKLQVKNNSSHTTRRASTDLPSPIEKESGGSYNHTSLFLPKEVSKAYVLLASDPDPFCSTCVSANICPTLSISTPTVETVDNTDASQVMQHFSEGDDMHRATISSLCSPKNIPCLLFGNDNFSIVPDNTKECADMMDRCQKAHPKVDIKNKARYEKAFDNEYCSNEYMEKANLTQIKANREDLTALKAGTDNPSQSFKIKKSADFVGRESSRCEVMPEQSLPEGKCESVIDTEVCHESPKSCSESIPANSFGFLNPGNSHMPACDGKRWQPEYFAVGCSDSTLPKTSCMNIDSSLRQVNAKVQTDRASLNSSDAGKNPFVLLNEVTNLKRASLCSDHEMLHGSSPGYRRLSCVQIPSSPRSFIDDLTACPQRLTRGHSQLMMMQPNEHPTSSKRDIKTQKMVPETTTKREIATTMLESESLFENLHRQDTEKIKINPLGVVKSTPPDFQFDHLSTKRHSIPPELKALSKSAILKDGHEEPVHQSCNDKNITKLVINPTRLTRARTKSLGLQQYSSDDLVAV